MSRLFGVLFSGRMLVLFLSETALVIGCFGVAVYLSGREEFELFWVVEHGAERVGVPVASILLAAYFVGLYDQIRIESRTFLVQQFCLVMGCAVLVQAGIQYVRNAWGLPRLVMLLATVGCLVILPAWRVFYSSVLLRRLNAERLLFVGATPTVQELAAHLRNHSELGFECLGLCGSGDDGRSQRVPGSGAVVPAQRPDRRAAPRPCGGGVGGTVPDSADL